MAEIQISIIEKIKKVLDVKGEIGKFDLYDLLYKSWINSHPDKFLDENVQKQAKEKFIELKGLLSELKILIDEEKLSSKPSDLVVYQEKYDVVQARSETVLKENENKKLIDEVNLLKTKNSSLIESLEKKEKSDLLEAQNELKELYKPKTVNLILFGVTAICLFSINVLANLSIIKGKLKEIIPVDSLYLNIGLFTVFLVVLFRLLLQVRKKRRVQRISDELKSTITIQKFRYEYVTTEVGDYYNYDYFFESSVTDFVIKEYTKRKYRKSFAFYIESLFVIEDHESINHLKDIFIYNLISNKLIEIGRTKNLDRMFRVK